MSIRGILRQRKKDLLAIAKKNKDDKSITLDAAIRHSEIDWVLTQMKKK